MCRARAPFTKPWTPANPAQNPWTKTTQNSYHTDPSGTYVKYGAMAIGSGSEGAATALQEGWRKDLTLAEAEVLALGTLKQVCACGLCRVFVCLAWL